MTDEFGERSEAQAPTPEEEAALAELERRLWDARPVPHPGFRATLRRELSEGDRPRLEWPAGLRLRVAAYASAGVALLAIAAVGVAGAGPFAAKDEKSSRHSASHSVAIPHRAGPLEGGAELTEGAREDLLDVGHA